MIKVIGHKSPDTDTVCSAIAYAWALNQKSRAATAFCAGKLNKETAYVLDKFGFETPEILESFSEGDEVVIVDTNNKDELVDGIESASIIEIIDHHKLTGSLSTDNPIPVIIKPLASTATIIWKYIKHSGFEVDSKIAGLLLCGIISDTLKFSSPTTTDQDKSAVDELLTITGESLDSLAEAMFAAKGDLTGMSTRDVVLVDSKVFEMGSKKVRVSTLESTKPENVLAIKDAIVTDMELLKSEEKLDYAFFFAIDILNSNATLLGGTPKERELAETAFNTSFDGDLMKLDGVVSRKKQIIPALQPVIESDN